MEEEIEQKTTPMASVQIGMGVLAVFMAIIGFFSSSEKVQSVAVLFLGGGLLLYGITNNNTDKSIEGKRTSYIASVFMAIFGILTIYRFFFLK